MFIFIVDTVEFPPFEVSGPPLLHVTIVSGIFRGRLTMRCYAVAEAI